MASTVAGIQAIIDAIDAHILSLASGGKKQSQSIGDHSWSEMSPASLLAYREALVKERDSISSGTEYVDHFDDSVTVAGVDDSVKVGETES
jgi:hypothetical protein